MKRKTMRKTINNQYGGIFKNLRNWVRGNKSVAALPNEPQCDEQLASLKKFVPTLVADKNKEIDDLKQEVKLLRAADEEPHELEVPYWTAGQTKWSPPATGQTSYGDFTRARAGLQAKLDEREDESPFFEDY